MIEKFCHQLREKRKELKLTIEQVVEKTKLFPGIIRSIEEGNLSGLDQTYIKGYLKIYASFLGLDSTQALTELGANNLPKKTKINNQQLNQQDLPPYLRNIDKPANLYPPRRFQYSNQPADFGIEPPKQAVEQKTETQVKVFKKIDQHLPQEKNVTHSQYTFDSPQKPEESPTDSFSLSDNFKQVSSLIAEVIEKIKSMQLFKNCRVFFQEKLTAQLKMVILKIVVGIIIALVFINVTKAVVVTIANVITAPKKAQASQTKPVVKKKTNKSSSLSESIAINNSAVSNELSLSVTAKNNCYIRVKVDSKLLFEGVLKKGSVDSWKGTKEIDMRMSDGSAVYIEVNGKALPTLTTMRKIIKSLKVTPSGITIDK